MPKLFLLRHLKSRWNQENRFTGWIDVPLRKKRTKRVKKISRKIFRFKIDIIYSSPLFRNQQTVAAIFEYVTKKYPIFIHLDKGKMKDWGDFKEITKDHVPVYITTSFNERYYGKLQGEDKAKTIKKHGSKKVHLWRRSFTLPPPGGEKLKDVYKRAVPFFKKYIEKDLKNGKNVVIVASHNPLRALIKYIENISNEDIINIEVPFAGLIKYKFSKSLKLKQKEIL